MTAYYNENDPKAAAWLRELIRNGHIADGIVDERSIEDVCPNDLEGYTQCHFFAGIGGWSYALRLAGWPDDRPVWTGSCPCQPFSAAGKGKGFADERHLWPAWLWLARQRRPGVIFGEQVANAMQWIDLVQGDLEAEGYTVAYAVLGAHSVGAPHVRQRLFWVAETSDTYRKFKLAGRPCGRSPWELSEFSGLVRQALSTAISTGHRGLRHDGLPGKLALGGFGNAIVPPQAAAFISAYDLC